MSIFQQLSPLNLFNLATALETKRLIYPPSELSLLNYLPSFLCQRVAQEFTLMTSQGANLEITIYFLRQLAQIQLTNQINSDRLELVWTGPEISGTMSRDTAIVVQELFATVQSKLLISSFALDKGKKGKDLFQILGQRMDIIPELEVKIFINIQRPYQSQIAESILLREFAEHFRHNIWTGKRFPFLFYDTRSLAPSNNNQSCLHAKCIVADQSQVFITSANFTQAAHQRNIETGILIKDKMIAQKLTVQFETLIHQNICKSVPSLGV
jgi:hypothetical protein